jgi:hypothetical protein
VYFVPCDASANPGDPTIIAYPPDRGGSCTYVVICSDAHQRSYSVGFGEVTAPCISLDDREIDICDTDAGTD